MKRTKKLGHPMSLRLEPDLKAALERLAAADARTLTSYINRALRRHVEAVEAPAAYAQKVAEVLAPTIAPKKKPAKKRA
jgi:predicted transcriptional regulator